LTTAIIEAYAGLEGVSVILATLETDVSIFSSVLTIAITKEYADMESVSVYRTI
jgi:hypothetical protein